MTDHSKNIFFPGIYHGREDEETYGLLVADLTLPQILEIVQKRVLEDGDFCITNGLVGDNEDKMRRMMEFAADGKNVGQCVAHIFKDGSERARTADWVCRDLANAAKVMVR